MAARRASTGYETERVVAQVDATGTLDLNGTRVPIKAATLKQLASGTLILDCERDMRVAGSLPPLGDKVGWVGGTGPHRLVLENEMLVGETQAFRGAGGSSHRFEIRASYATIGDPPAQIVRACAQIVNYRTVGSQTWSLPGAVVSLEPVDDYRERIRRLELSKGIDVTATLTVELQEAMPIGDFENWLDRLCVLLSLARCNAVTWVQFDGSGTTWRRLRNSITKSFGKAELVVSNPPLDTKVFVESCFLELLKLDPRWDFRKCVRAYVDARREGDFLESRALKMAALLDYLVNACRAIEGAGQNLPKKIFKDWSRRAKRALQVVAEDYIAERHQEREQHREGFQRAIDHLLGANREPFRAGIERVVDRMRLEVSSDEISETVWIRNALVHEMRFPDGCDNFESYCRLATFVGRLLLALVRHPGHYRDFAVRGGWEGEGAHRKPMIYR